MFGVIISSRPVLTSPTQLSDTQYAFQIRPTPPFNHLVVFLLPGQTLPASHAAAIYLRIPPAPSFRLLGAVGNEKPSAIFKVNVAGPAASSTSSLNGTKEEVMLDDATLQPVEDTSDTAGDSAAQQDDIVLGISIEPAAQIEAQLAAARSSNSSQSHQPSFTPPAANALVRNVSATASASLAPQQVKVLAQHVGTNAYNFLQGFARRDTAGGEEVVPTRALQEWYRKFEKRVDLDPGFLFKDDG